MNLFIGQCLLAAVFYPFFLVLLNLVCGYFVYGSEKAKRFIGLILLLSAMAACYFALFRNADLSIGFSIYPIASSLLFIILAQYCIRTFRLTKPKAVVYPLALLIQQLLFYGTLIEYGANLTAHDGKYGQIFVIVLTVELARWVITILLGAFMAVRYKSAKCTVLLVLNILGLAGIFWMLPNLAPNLLPH